MSSQSDSVKQDTSYSDAPSSPLSAGILSRRSRANIYRQKQSFTFEQNEQTSTKTRSQIVLSSKGQRTRNASSSIYASSNEGGGDSLRSSQVYQKEPETINKNWLNIMTSNEQQPSDDPRKDIMKKLIDKRLGIEKHGSIKRKTKRHRVRASSSLSSSAAIVETGNETVQEEEEESLQRSVSNVDISTIALQEDEQMDPNIVRRAESCDIVPTSDQNVDCISQVMFIPKTDDERQNSDEVKVLSIPENSNHVLVTTKGSTENMAKSVNTNQIVINILSSNPDHTSTTSINVTPGASGVTNVYVGTMPVVTAQPVKENAVIKSEPDNTEEGDKKQEVMKQEVTKRRCCFCCC